MNQEEPPHHPDVIPDTLAEIDLESPAIRRNRRALQQLLKRLPYLYLDDDPVIVEVAAGIEKWLDRVSESQARLLLWYGVLDRSYAVDVPARLDARWWRLRLGDQLKPDWRSVMRKQAKNDLRRFRDRDTRDADAWDILRAEHGGTAGTAVWRRRLARYKLETLPAWVLIFFSENSRPPDTEPASDTKIYKSRKSAYHRAITALQKALNPPAALPMADQPA